MISPAIESIHKLMLEFGYSIRRMRRRKSIAAAIVGGGDSGIKEGEEDEPKACRSR